MRWPISPRLIVVLSLALAIVTLAVYLRTSTFGFVLYDDDQYVYNNPQVQNGLTANGVVWALTTFFFANWHPLTWISLMLDSTMFGTGPGARHLVNVVLHAANAIVLLLFLTRATRTPWLSAFVAAVFTLHPLHVESVAWISERKDVLSTLFGLIALWVYVLYVEHPSWKRYLLLLVAFGASLLSKSMLVTLPFIMLLLDFWPLARLGWPPGWSVLRHVMREKIPLFVMSAAASLITFVAQHRYGAVAAEENLGLALRLENAAMAYLAYLGKIFVPIRLAALYPYTIPTAGAVVLALVVLGLITAISIYFAADRPYLLTGWLWYLGTLVPVIGIVQVGVQSMADRYTYIPAVGVTIAVAWCIADFTASRKWLQKPAAGLAILVLVVLSSATYVNAGYWKDSRTLFAHALEVTSNNYVMLNNMGVALADLGQFKDAEQYYAEALRIKPHYALAHANVGHALLLSGHQDDAGRALQEALRLKPDLSAAHEDFGFLLASQGNYDGALPHLKEAARLAPFNADAHNNLCFVLQRMGQAVEAIGQCAEALRLKPNDLAARFNLGTALASAGRKNEAVKEFSAVLAANPGHAGARAALRQLQ